MILVLVGFAGFFIWVIRYARAQEAAKIQAIERAGFRADASPEEKERLTEAWGPLTGSLYARRLHGYTLWRLEKRDSEGAGEPFLVATFNTLTLYPYDAWVIPAVAGEGGLAQKMISLLARLGGNKHRLPVPTQYANRWWAWSPRSQWMPSPPPEAFWEALSGFPSIAVQFQKSGVKFDLMPFHAGNRTTNDDLVGKATLGAVDKIVSTLG